MVNIEQLRKKYQEINNPGGSGGNNDFLSKFFMMDEGTSVVRVLPSKSDDREFYAETAIHRINDKNYHCPRVKDQKCPVCDTYYDLWKEINSIGKDTPITDLKEGWDFKIVKDTQGQWPNYDKSAPKPKQSTAGSDAENATFMDELHDIHGLVKIAAYDDLKNLMLELNAARTGSPVASASETPAPMQSESEDDYMSHLKDLKVD